MPREKPPPTRRKFFDGADEAEYTREKLNYWLYRDHTKARPFAIRMKAWILSRGAAPLKTILGNEAMRDASEVLREWDAAAMYGRREIRLIERFRSSASPGDRKNIRVTHAIFPPTSLSLRHHSLVWALLNAGRLRAARRAFLKGEAFSKKHKVEWEGEYLRRLVGLDKTPPDSSGSRSRSRQSRPSKGRQRGTS